MNSDVADASHQFVQRASRAGHMVRLADFDALTALNAEMGNRIPDQFLSEILSSEMVRFVVESREFIGESFSINHAAKTNNY